jgi:hypothetical protein
MPEGRDFNEPTHVRRSDPRSRRLGTLNASVFQQTTAVGVNEAAHAGWKARVTFALPSTPKLASTLQTSGRNITPGCFKSGSERGEECSYRTFQAGKRARGALPQGVLPGETSRERARRTVHLVR